MPLGLTIAGYRRKVHNQRMTTAVTKKRHHVWLWIFLAIQALFLVWIITGVASSSATDCGTLSKAACTTATEAGTGIGVMLIVGFWFGVDVVMLLIKLVVQLSRRHEPQTA